MDIETRLLSLKKEIERKKYEKAKLEGELNQVNQQLKEMGCTSVQEAEAQIHAIQKDLNTNTTAVETVLTQLEGAVWN